MLLALYILSEVVPVSNHLLIVRKRHHFQRLTKFVSRTYICAVTASHTVENAYLDAEVHACHWSWNLHGQCLVIESLHFFLIQYKRTNGCVRANVGTFVALDAVFGCPLGVECFNAALLVGSRTIQHGAVYHIVFYEIGHFQQIAILRVDGAYDFFDVCRNILFRSFFIICKVCPCRVNRQLLILHATFYGGIILVNDVLALVSVRLHDEFLHLFYRKVNGDDFGDAEEGTLENGVGTVAQTNFLRNLRCVDVVYGNVVLSEVALQSVRNEVCQLFSLKDSVQKECAILAQTANHVIHSQVCLNVASHEVWCDYFVSRMNGLISKTKV